MNLRRKKLKKCEPTRFSSFQQRGKWHRRAQTTSLALLTGVAGAFCLTSLTPDVGDNQSSGRLCPSKENSFIGDETRYYTSDTKKTTKVVDDPKNAKQFFFPLVDEKNATVDKEKPFVPLKTLIPVKPNRAYRLRYQHLKDVERFNNKPSVAAFDSVGKFEALKRIGPDGKQPFVPTKGLIPVRENRASELRRRQGIETNSKEGVTIKDKKLYNCLWGQKQPGAPNWRDTVSRFEAPKKWGAAESLTLAQNQPGKELQVKRKRWCKPVTLSRMGSPNAFAIKGSIVVRI